MSTLVPIVRDSRLFDLGAGVGQTSFSFPRPLLDAADLAVSLKVAPALVFSAAADFTVTLTSGGATVDFATAPRPLPSSPEVTVRLAGRRVAARTTDVTRGGALNGAAIDREFDLTALTLQELRRDIDALAAALAISAEGGDIAAADVFTAQIAALQAQIAALNASVAAELGPHAAAAVAAHFAAPAIIMTSTFTFDPANAGRLHIAPTTAEWSANVPAGAASRQWPVLVVGSGPVRVYPPDGATLVAPDLSGHTRISATYSMAQVISLPDTGAGLKVLLMGATEP